MPPSKQYEIVNLHIQQNQYTYAGEEKKPEFPPLLNWPVQGYFDRLKPDADLLQQALSVSRDYPSGHLSEQVFGADLKNQTLNLHHLSNLFYERSHLHQNHLADINSRHVKTQERLFGAEISHTPDRAKNIQRLEAQLMQLEQQRRDEESAFWKDTVDLRQQMFETASDYRSVRQRYAIFSDLEDGQDG